MTVPAPNEALRQAREALSALAEDRRCNVCWGLSPTWDGHDKSPMCRVTALDVLARVLSPERDEQLRQEGREQERAAGSRAAACNADHQGSTLYRCDKDRGHEGLHRDPLGTWA